MENRMARQSSRFIFSLLLLLVSAQSARVLSQTKPAEQPTPPNYTRPTVLTRPVAQPATPATTTTKAPSQPASAGAVALPDIAPPPQPVIITHGLLVETLDGKLVAESAIDQGFNPASAVKLGTALAALRNFGADHRFATAVWTTGTPPRGRSQAT